MGGQLLNVADAQAGGRKNALGGIKRKVGKMFVIDGVELRSFDEPHHVGKFQRDGAVGLEHCLQPPGEVVDVGDVGVNVVAGD